MDWTFWVGAVVIVGLVIVTQVFLHESRWTRRPRQGQPLDAEPAKPADPRESEAPVAPDARGERADRSIDETDGRDDRRRTRG